MKTPQDWFPETEKCRSDKDVIELIKQIQLDAVKHGMSLAMTEVLYCHDMFQDTINQAVCRSVKEAILTARDNLKESNL